MKGCSGERAKACVAGVDLAGKELLMTSHLHRSFLVILAILASGFAVGCGARFQPSGAASPEDYLFCFWNVENLFDDQNDGRTSNEADKEYDGWFARDGHALRLKLDHLSSALVDLNEGRGPDILAVAEVEGPRAAELLQQALNSRLADPALHYSHVLMKDLAAGRHIAPAIITRLPVKKDRTRLHGSHLRILEGRIVVNGQELVVLASHWTSRQADESGKQRAKYADQIYGVCQAMYLSNPKIAVLVCGDFNDPPDADSVTIHLHATGDTRAVLDSREGLKLLNLFADKDPLAFGTHYYHRRWQIFDQIVVSPGLLEEQGWSCDRQSARTVNTLIRPGDRTHRPWRFGGEHDRGPRGYSDHFPVTVRLKVTGEALASKEQ
jgi:endonuclease/exonuclease/phosphatase family metal-dependent hydrolase